MRIINIAEQPNFGAGETFHWIADRADPGIEWAHFSTVQHPWLIKIKRPYLARYMTVFRAIWSAKKTPVDLIVSHGTLMAIWVGMIKRLLGVKTRHLAWSFTLPYYNDKNRIRNALMRFGTQDIDRFIMYSVVETRNYPKYLQLPADRFRMIPWSMNEPEVNKTSNPEIKGHYIAAMGREGRDYPTLVQAMTHLPDIKLVIVASPENLMDIDIPENVEVRTNIPYEQAMNIAWHADFMVLPLLSDTIPCGHGSLLAQFLLDKATIVTDSIAMEGYSFPGENVRVYQAQNPDSLTAQIKSLWEHPEQARQLSEKARNFAETRCSEASTIEYFHRYLHENNLLPTPPINRPSDSAIPQQDAITG